MARDCLQTGRLPTGDLCGHFVIQSGHSEAEDAVRSTSDGKVGHQTGVYSDVTVLSQLYMSKC